MKQDMNDTFRIALRAMVMAAMTLLTVSTATAQDTPTGPRVRGNVYGGGNLATVGGSVTVNMRAGTVEKDVYGGGALANTNINNATNYGTESENVSSTSTNTTTVNLTGGTIMGDAYGGGLGRIKVTAVAGEKYTQEEIDAAQEGDPAYGKTTEDWKVEPVEGVEGVEATVYGDIYVTLGGARDANGSTTTASSSATGFYITNYTGDHSDVIKSGRVFGCNNLNGSPKGNVTVTVYKTVAGNHSRTAHATDNENRPQTGTGVTPSYELAAVYGGGNLADFTTSGKKANVRIMKCDVSIRSVYGGGNAAAVPETDVLVNGAYEIAEVFGGGNGKDQYSLDSGTTWLTNPGANVNGNANTLLKGGYIHEAYGGSNSKGTITGNVTIMKSSGGDCDLNVIDLYGAGKDADVEGDLIMVMGCSDSRTENVYGCAKNANVKGNVELTITSGEYGKVFGGNNVSGAIFGHIIVNIEETGCTPIIIDELYGCGNDAPYSVYGYWKDPNEVVPEGGKPTYITRTSSEDHVDDLVTFEDKPHTRPPYDDPQVNIFSCTRIGKVFGGGYGAGATVYGNPQVNINMMKGAWAGKTYGTVAIPDQLGKVGDGYTDADANEVEGGVFGGGNEASVEGNTTVNIGNLIGEQVDLAILDNAGNPVKDSNGNYTFKQATVTGANITGSVYGGGNLANVGRTHLEKDENDKDKDVIDVVGNTFVNICAVRGAEIMNGNQATGRYNYTAVNLTEGAVGVTIGGDVFGGGKGEAADPGDGPEPLAGAFRCGKAMVTGATNVAIGNGTVSGTVYGGGEVGRVEQNTSVTIGMDEGKATGGTSTPIIMHDVYGAGKGVMTHGYAALVRGHAYVTVVGNAQVRHSVYGGGEIASVGRYNIADDAYHTAHPEVEVGMPYSLKDQGSGYCYVNVGGYAEIGEDDMSMTEDGGPDDFGYIFGAGKGILPYDGYKSTETPWRVHPSDTKEKYTSDKENDYLLFIESLALATQTYVTVGDHAFVKGSVYGGSENGHVQHDTDVRIQDNCQIGNGWDATKNEGAGGGVNARYDEALFINPATATPEEINTSATTLKECSSWVFGKDTDSDGKADTFEPYDKHGAAGGGATTASDGHTFYGNVFGGGSGLYAFDRQNRISGKDNHEWLRSAGRVYGNTNVTITGGHILTSVYGGCELTDVGNGRSIEEGKGKCTVKMSGGTLGVPRTLPQIAKHPVTCYLFGAGKGDQRAHFNQWTNVDNVEVEVSGNAIIYGSVFGGGEDGHVLGDTKVTIKENAVIGTWGTSYVDGNIFGAGRGFGGDALTAGVVCGNVDIDIQGGTLLGSVYGGGRLGSVGTYLVPSTHANYGKLIPDGKTITINEDEETATETDQEGITHGEISISISGGTIGNNIEYAYIAPTVTGDALTTAKTYMPNTDHDGQNRLTHTKGGNVFAGAMGRLNGLAEGTFLEHWPDLGKAKKTTLNISGGTIKSNVYGGGELGTLEQGSTISITGGTIGTEIAESVTTGEGEGATTSDVVHYTFGSVFGGGAGSSAHRNGTLTDNTTVNTDDHAGLVKGSTKITMSAGAVKGSVYGGGELAIVQGSHTTESKTVGAEINISGGTIGYNQDGFGGATMGNVYGGGKGSLETQQAGLIKSNTLINISGGTIYHNIYGGGAYGSVGTFTYETPSGSTQPASTPSGCTEGGTAWINITGGTIGINGHENGMVFGSSRGDVAAPDATGEDPNNKLAWTKDTYVTIGTSAGSNLTPWIMGSVYGSGENGHVLTNTDVTIHDGKIGIEEDDGAKYDITSGNTTYKGAAYPSRGNVYGGGCGTDTYLKNGVETFNPLAGVVYGTTTINMDGGQVARNIYGAGAMGSVGKATTANDVTTVSGGTTTINVSGGQVGVSGTVGDGNIFGAARGDASATINQFALVRKSTNVSVTGGTIKGNVYGGGELGSVGTFTVSNDMRTFTWTDTDGTDNAANNEKNTGVCHVTVNGSSADINGKVFGGGKGLDDTFWCEKGIAYSTKVNIVEGTVTGNVYGGGEVGRVETDSYVKIGDDDGTTEGTSTPSIMGSVFGGGAGVETHGYSALVRGNTTVTVEGNASVAHSVYGGGEIASVGKYGLDAQKMPSILQGGGYCYVTVQGNATIADDVFGAGEGVKSHFDNNNSDRSKRSRRMTVYSNSTDFPEADKYTANAESYTWEYYESYPNNYQGPKFVWDYLQTPESYSTYLETLALATHPEVTIDGSASIGGSVFGGGELGLTKGSVIVNIQGGTIAEDVYGGGSLANTNTTTKADLNNDGTLEDYTPTTTVKLTGGTIARNVYGGGLGRLAKEAVAAVLYTAEDAEVTKGTKNVGDVKTPAQPAVEAIAAKVYGNVLVELNKTTATDNCVVKGNIFGCNNLNGSPQASVTVHVYKTADYADHEKDASKSNSKFNVKAVYGGGNLAAYYPDDATTRDTAKANVIIDGCDLTSIGTVYGGGNAASVPETDVVINGTYEIGQAFGGGNGKDQVSYDGGATYVDNPGANVGYLAYTDDSEKASKTYGTGRAHVTIYGGTVHSVYGGSNTKGNVRLESVCQLDGETNTSCDFNVGEAYGGGRSADQDGSARLIMNCIPGLGDIYGGAENADVQSVTLNITNGTYGRVFGGNNRGGRVNGPIVVNIEETGCRPIRIGELYGGGNQAAYSVYGYQATSATLDGKPVWAPLKAGDTGALGTPYSNPTLNIRSFTSIGNVYGGGYGETAKMVADPQVNINVVTGDRSSHDEAAVAENARIIGATVTTNAEAAGYTTAYPIPSHVKGEKGAINNVFGGGNAAEVIGTPHVMIGTSVGDNVVFATPTTATIEQRTHKVEGVDIRGNVFGGGNNAVVTGNTNVEIGKKNDGN